MLGIQALLRMVVLVILSHQEMFKNTLWVVHVEGFGLLFLFLFHFHCQRIVLTTQALYTRISVCSVSFLLFHTIFVNVDMVIATLPIHLFSSVSRTKEPEIIEPR